MRKKQPGQVVLDVINLGLLLKGTDTSDEWKQRCDELRGWRAAFKKMAGAVIGGGNKYSSRYYFYPDEKANHEAAKAILKAREIEARRIAAKRREA